jgi:hypothetical protein
MMVKPGTGAYYVPGTAAMPVKRLRTNGNAFNSSNSNRTAPRFKLFNLSTYCPSLHSHEEI